MEYNFNKITDRHNTNACKLDLAVIRGKPADVLSLWVADMDFPTSPAPAWTNLFTLHWPPG